ncbi:MAG: recombinase RecA [Myxococcales bacterium]|nr:recombinase RecA [Myxococcales bacterium]MCB9707894.1 recombinase RecA [Myxococcales bacterium]
MTMKEKLKAMGVAINAIEKQFGKGAIMSLGQRNQENIAVLCSGSRSLDIALGSGYPRGRIIEVFGPESSGKTTLTLHAIAEAQRAEGIAAFIDAEHALDVQYARRLGVDAERLLVSQPDSGEQALDIAEALVRSAAIDLVVIDSVAALVPRAEIEGDMGDHHMGLQARLMSQALRKLTGIAFRSGTTMIFINQLRTKIGVTFGSPETTTGGNALKFYASVRMDVRRIGQVKVADAVIGNRTRVKVVKNKLAPPFQVAEFDLRYAMGIDRVGDTLDLAVSHGIVTRNGAYYAFADTQLGQGREKARETLIENASLYGRLDAAILASLSSGKGAAKPESPGAIAAA